MEAATQILSYMEEKGIEANVAHFTSAINACANAHHPDRAKQAQALFNTMLAKGVEPDIAIYGSLLGALQDESPQCCKRWLADMESRNVKPNREFTEIFLFTFLRVKKDGKRRSQNELRVHLKRLQPGDLDEAQRFIVKCRKANVHLNGACKAIDSAAEYVQRQRARAQQFG